MTTPTDHPPGATPPELEGQVRARRHLAIVQPDTEGLHPLGATGIVGPGRAGDVAPLGDDHLQVGELARRTGKTVRAIHLYESMGLLTPVLRTRGRFRLFNRDSEERVRWIAKLQAVGFSLPEIQDIVRGQESSSTAVEAAKRLRAVYLERLSGVQAKLSELHRLEHELLSSLTYLDACQSACDAEAPVESCPSCGKHLDQPKQPALVSGLHVS